MVRGLLYLGFLTGWLVGAFTLMDLLLRWFTGQLRVRRPLRRPGQESLPTTRRPVQDVAGDLRRLSRQLALIPAGTPQARRLGLQQAYDDVLIEACRQLEIPQALREVSPGQARDAERRRVEIALSRAGIQGLL